MVMDVYMAVFPKPKHPIFRLEKWNEESSDPPTILGVFDELETALHALDVVSKFRANHMKVDDYYTVSRMSKNSLEMRQVELVRWTCTGESERGCYFGKIELQQGLRTHDVEQ